MAFVAKNGKGGRREFGKSRGGDGASSGRGHSSGGDSGQNAGRSKTQWRKYARNLRQKVKKLQRENVKENKDPEMKDPEKKENVLAKDRNDENVEDVRMPEEKEK